ncbi:hypothetical protein HDZ31DRAFT_73762 [Schizophyllum fasciatum]
MSVLQHSPTAPVLSNHGPAPDEPEVQRSSEWYQAPAENNDSAPPPVEHRAPSPVIEHLAPSPEGGHQASPLGVEHRVPSSESEIGQQSPLPDTPQYPDTSYYRWPPLLPPANWVPDPNTSFSARSPPSTTPSPPVPPSGMDRAPVSKCDDNHFEQSGAQEAAHAEHQHAPARYRDACVQHQPVSRARATGFASEAVSNYILLPRQNRDMFRFGVEESAAAPEMQATSSISPSLPAASAPVRRSNRTRASAGPTAPVRAQPQRAGRASVSRSRRSDKPAPAIPQPMIIERTEAEIAEGIPVPIIPDKNELLPETMQVDPNASVSSSNNIDEFIDESDARIALRRKQKEGEADRVEHGSHDMAERIEHLRTNMCASFFDAHHVCCAVCGQKFETDKRANSLWDKHCLEKCQG